MQCPWRNLWRGIRQTSRRSITLAGVGIIYRLAAFAVQTARHATNASGVVAEIGKRAASGENARHDESGTSVEHGSANVSGAGGMITESAGNITGLGPPHSGPFQLETTKDARCSRSQQRGAKQSTLLCTCALCAEGRHRGHNANLSFENISDPRCRELIGSLHNHAAPSAISRELLLTLRSRCRRKSLRPPCCTSASRWILR